MFSWPWVDVRPGDDAVLHSMVVGDALGGIPAQQQAAVLALMLATALWAGRGGVLRLAAFVACCLLWSRANQAFEGAVLWSLGPEHGITVADLLPPAATAWVVLRRRHRVGRRPATAARARSAGQVSADPQQASQWVTPPPFGPCPGVALRD